MGNQPSSSMTNKSQSTERTMAIIELLARAKQPMRLRDIGQALNMNASTTFRFLNTLVSCGYVLQEKDTSKYYLGYKILRIANQLNSKNELQVLTHPYLVRLSSQLQESTCISVENDMTMVYIDVASGPDQHLMSMQRVGNVSPMHSTGNGKLLLLNYTEDMLDELIARKGLARFTDYTITTKQELLKELESIRTNGYAWDNQENEIGLCCLAFPIYDYTGRIIAGISATGPAIRMGSDKLLGMKTLLAQTASEISAALGYSAED